jgi:hypothetical protein
MSYVQAMKWSRNHPKGTRQPVLMSTSSGFWPAKAWLDHEYFPYRDSCHVISVEPVGCEAFYRHVTTTCYPRTPDDYAAMTKAGNL